MNQAFVDELSEFLRIPSVSADSAHAPDVRRAGDWVCERIRAAGGEADLVDWEGQPLAVGEIRASANVSAPTVLCYGHFDVQPPAPLDLWDSGPFEPTVHDEYLVARGVVDDKGQLYMLLKAAELLAASGELPVNLRFACDGEEETGGHSIVDFLAADERGADACVIFDAGMLARGVPAFYIATRGMCYFHVRVRTGAQDLHSGLMGGAAMNSLHALMQTLSGVLPRDGRVPEPLRAGVAEITAEELSDWASLTPGDVELSQSGARPADGRAAEEFYLRTWGEPSVDVHGIAGGEPHLTKTVLPVFAEANVSIRLAPGQSVDEIAPAFERLLREAAPAGADVEVALGSTADPGLVAPDSRAIELGQEAFERVIGARPLLVRSGGTLPIVPALEQKGIPTIVTGFSIPGANAHAPNERLLLEYLPLGVEAAKELFRAWAEL
ncbi:MAG: M20/M25/M40 family metallo-hydrolase [Actinobacteria bacterium]|nr:M20/M25/M40 family metallo-hydrolase [Actinomycetota bacterium]